MSCKCYPNILTSDDFKVLDPAFRIAAAKVAECERELVAAWTIKLYQRGITDPYKLSHLVLCFVEAQSAFRDEILPSPQEEKKALVGLAGRWGVARH